MYFKRCKLLVTKFKMMRSILLSFFCFFIAFSSLQAQYNIGFYYNHTLPQGVFADNAENQVGGFMCTVLVNPFQNKRFSVGGEVGVSMYANDDFEYTVSQGDFQGRYIEVNQDDCFWQYGATARYHLTDMEAKKVFNPYLETRAGGISFFSTLTQGEECEVDYHSETETHGSTFYAGLGGGITFQLNNFVLIDLNGVYNKSGQSAYRHIPEPEDVTYRLELTDHMYESRTDHISLRLGMIVGF